MGGYENGFSWHDPDRQFHYHPTFMAMGIIFLQGEAIIVYRVFRHEKKRFTKLLHLTIHSIVLVFMLVGLKAVWDSHDFHLDEKGQPDPLPNLYSIHSWLGIIMVTGYVLQFTGGLVTFFYPGLSMDLRKFFLPFHQLFGVLIFVSVTAVALMGISEYAAWHHK
uniref:Cytochrome b561 domain-containing protein n=1 Tax=Acrobeloides nanus TaxID=290746 RepID=A0A914CGW6_9BILA